MAIPIPQRPSGFTLGDSNANVRIDVFIDIQCPHSRQVWPNLLDLLSVYHSKSVSVTVHLITLSNHRQAWDVSLGIFAFAEGNDQLAFDFITFLFANQERYYNAAFQYKTHDDLRELVAGFAVEFAQVKPDQFLQRMQDHDVYIAARTPIRFAATRAVWATPTLFINNADDVPVNHSSSVDDWKLVIDPLLKD